MTVLGKVLQDHDFRLSLTPTIKTGKIMLSLYSWTLKKLNKISLYRGSLKRVRKKSHKMTAGKLRQVIDRFHKVQS